MNRHITSAAASKSSTNDKLENALSANERFKAYLETVEEKLAYASNEMPAGNIRDKEIYDCWLLIMMAKENFEQIDQRISEANEAYLAERRAA